MKKTILSITCAVLSATAVMAQTSGENDNAGGVQNTASLTLTLGNVITMSEQNSSMGATFANAADYNGNMTLTTDGNGVEGLSPSSHYTAFTVQSNRYFNVTIKAASANMAYTGATTNNGNDDVTMPVSTIQYNCYATPLTSGGGGGIAHAQINLSASDQAALDNVKYGPNQVFYMSFTAYPGWNYAGGSYTTTATITATQE